MEKLKEGGLPRRDWILLPLIGVVTLCVLAALTESIARRYYSATTVQAEDCMVLNDAATGTRGIPGCVCWEKIAENQPVEYRFNRNGYRANEDFGPKLPSTYRIVLVGSSYAFGMRVPIEKAFATQLPAELSARTGRRTELFNEAMAGQGGGPHSVALRLTDAFAAKPDMILWVLTPWDIAEGEAVMPGASRKKPGALYRLLHPHESGLTAQSLFNTATRVLRLTHTTTMLLHALYQSQNLYMQSFELEVEQGSQGFLKTEPDAMYQNGLKSCAEYAAEVEVQATQAGVPVVAVFLPNLGQAEMISKGKWAPGYDPYKLDNELRAIITRHGGIYLDVLPDFRSVTNPERYYFVIDGHPNAKGHALMADMMARALTSGAVPALTPGAPQRTQLARGQ